MVGGSGGAFGLQAFELLDQRCDRVVQVADPAEPTREVDPDRGVTCGLTDRRRAQAVQQPAHLGRREGADPQVALDQRSHGVVGIHQPGAPHPTDRRGDQVEPPAPSAVLRGPLLDDHLERGLGLAVGAVATETALVGRHGQHHRGPTTTVAEPGLGRGHRGQQSLDPQQQDAQRHLGAAVDIDQITGDGARGEREDQRRQHRVLQRAGDPAGRVRHGVHHPVDEVVDVGERREVRPHHVQLRARRRGDPVELPVAVHALGAVVGRRAHDDCAVGEQPAHHLERDRPGGRARDERDLTATRGHRRIRRTGQAPVEVLGPGPDPRTVVRRTDQIDELRHALRRIHRLDEAAIRVQRGAQRCDRRRPGATGEDAFEACGGLRVTSIGGPIREPPSGGSHTGICRVAGEPGGLLGQCDLVERETLEAGTGTGTGMAQRDHVVASGRPPRRERHVALRVEPRPHGGGATLTVLRVEQRQASGRGVVDGVDRAAGRSDPLEHVARHRRE